MLKPGVPKIILQKPTIITVSGVSGRYDLDQMQDTETTAFVELPAPAPDPKKTDTPKESGTCISAGTLPMIRIKNTRGLSAEIFSGTSPEMLCHLIKAFTHAE